MDHFEYRNGTLACENVPLDRIAEQVGTPTYVYSRATIERHYKVFAEAFKDLNATVCYAIKANSNIAVIRCLANLGSGAALVSGGELARALKGGIPGHKLVFSGVGKTVDEMNAGLDAGILQFNVESEPELQALSAVAQARGMVAPVALRINPDIDAGVHAKITTGKSENKFGIEWTRAHEVCKRAAALPGVKIVGLSLHIGSQLTNLQPFRDAFVRLSDLVAILRADGHEIVNLDLGGGLGVPYTDDRSPSPEDYAGVVRDTVGRLGCHLVLEPGRLIVGNAGVLLTRTIFRKEGATRSFLILDAGMNDLMRPALYDAYHAIVPVTQPAAKAELETIDVVGPICETGDTFAKQRQMPPVKGGDLLAIRTAGAYSAVMSSVYNTRPQVAEVLVDGDHFAVVRKRLSVDEMLARETIPDWLDPK